MLETSLATGRKRRARRLLPSLVVGTLGLWPALASAQLPAGRQVQLRLTKRFQVGGSLDSVFTPNILFPHDIATDARGNLFVLDRTTNQVHQYDARGARRRSMGGRGGGPGEIVRPTSIAADKAGTLVVVDNGKRALVRISREGKPLPELPTKGLGVVQAILSLRQDHMILYATVSDSDAVTNVRGESRVRLATLAPAARRPVKAYERCGLVGQTSAPMLGDRLLAAADESHVATNDGDRFGIVVFVEGKPPRTFRSGSAAQPLTKALALRLLGDSIQMLVASRPCAISTATLIDEAGIAPTAPPYTQLVMSPKETIWAVRTGANDTERLVDLYSASTGYIGWAKIGKLNPVAFLSDGGIVSLEKDDGDTPVVVVYDVVQR